MSTTSTTYPSGPLEIPKRFTQLPNSYKIKVSLAVIAIILFFVLYMAMIAGFCLLTYYAIIYDMGSINKFTILLKIGAIAGSAMLFAFSLKFILKLKNVQPNNRVKIDLTKNPKLKSFIDNICKDTNAPKPKNVYVDPDVNAYVSYNNIWLSLFFPTKKNLTIGLGLVSCLNLSEFKAVVAHEFGHFAQRSMKVGSYINSANTIIHSMIFERDAWDNTLDKWRSSDFRIAIFAWIITPVVWLIRQFLILFYQLLNIAYSSLSREMEFNADKVAVSVSGSEAIISSLWKLDHGFKHYNEVINHGYLASKNNLFVKNFYTHVNSSITNSKDEILNQINSLPTDEKGVRTFFSTSKNSNVGMYASHPPNDLREGNAKSPFIPCDTDDRSSWVLFDHKIELQEKLTALIYKQYIGKKPESFSEDRQFQDFIKSETKGNHLLEKYHNTFQNRFVTIPKDDELKITSSQVDKPIEKIKDLESDLIALMKPVNELSKHLEEIGSIAQGSSKSKTFEYLGVSYKKKQMQQVFEKVNADRERLFNEAFKEWDATFFASYYKISSLLERKEHYASYLQQHKLLIGFYKILIEGRSKINQRLSGLQAMSEVSEQTIRTFENEVSDLFHLFNKQLKNFNSDNFRQLPNIENVETLKGNILESKEFSVYSRNIFESGSFNIMMNELETAINHLNRIEQNSMSHILEIHENMFLSYVNELS